MQKITLSLLMLIMKYQGNKGKYYKIQKVSLIITAVFSFFIVGVVKLFLYLSKGESFFTYLAVWGILFLLHYVWFLNVNKSKAFLHFKEFRICLFVFVFLAILSFIINLYSISN